METLEIVLADLSPRLKADMLKWNYNLNVEQTCQSFEPEEKFETTRNVNENHQRKTASRWKKIGNTVKFINRSKNSRKYANGQHKQENLTGSKWILLKNTLSIVNFFSRIQRNKSTEVQKVPFTSQLFDPAGLVKT